MFLLNQFLPSVVFFGIGMTQLPGRNFARFLLMLYILFCLVIRTAYQGKQFEFLQKDMRPADVETIDEMIEKNFTFHVENGSSKSFKEMDFFKRFRSIFGTLSNLKPNLYLAGYKTESITMNRTTTETFSRNFLATA